MYGLFYTDDRLWSHSAGLCFESRLGTLHYRTGADAPDAPALLPPAEAEAVGVDPVLRARFWRLALPTLGLFWAGVVWSIVA